MTHTVAGLFDSHRVADLVVEHLVQEYGIPRERVRVHAGDAAGTAEARSPQDSDQGASLPILAFPRRRSAPMPRVLAAAASSSPRKSTTTGSRASWQPIGIMALPTSTRAGPNGAARPQSIDVCADSAVGVATAARLCLGGARSAWKGNELGTHRGRVPQWPSLLYAGTRVRRC